MTQHQIAYHISLYAITLPSALGLSGDDIHLVRKTIKETLKS